MDMRRALSAAGDYSASSKLTCTRRIEFDAGHRIIGHNGKCRFLHGHRYILEVTVESISTNNIGFVADFGDIKHIVKSWIDEYFDHNVILSVDDKELGDQISTVTKQVPYYMKCNPSAENILLHLMYDILPMIFQNQHFSVTKLRLYETPNCYAEICK